MATPVLVRINKLLADKGICSRREADRLIAQGFVRVNGRTARLGDRAKPSARLQVDSNNDFLGAQKTILLHKPLKIVSSQPENSSQTPAVRLLTARRHFWKNNDNDVADGDAANVNHFAPSAQDPRNESGWASAGRLDRMSTGLLVLTQSGKIARQLVGPDKTNIEKEYWVRASVVANTQAATSPDQQRQQQQNSWSTHDFSSKILDHLREGAWHRGDFLTVHSVETRSQEKSMLPTSGILNLRLILTEGKKHHIRRLCRCVGLQVQALHRVRIGSIHLDDLPVGQWRYLGPDESFV